MSNTLTARAKLFDEAVRIQGDIHAAVQVHVNGSVAFAKAPAEVACLYQLTDDGAYRYLYTRVNVDDAAFTVALVGIHDVDKPGCGCVVAKGRVDPQAGAVDADDQATAYLFTQAMADQTLAIANGLQRLAYVNAQLRRMCTYAPLPESMYQGMLAEENRRLRAAS